MLGVASVAPRDGENRVERSIRIQIARCQRNAALIAAGIRFHAASRVCMPPRGDTGRDIAVIALARHGLDIYGQRFGRLKNQIGLGGTASEDAAAALRRRGAERLRSRG